MINAAISVIVPCYNQAQYLAEALDSVLAQTYTSWECIIVNDGSTDDTEQIAEKYTATDTRFKYLYKDNGGLSSARNAGIKAALAEYILPLDADDKIGEEYIRLALLAFQENHNLKLVYCMANKFGHENIYWELKKYSYPTILLENCIFCAAIFKKQHWAEANGYDEDLKHGWEDWAFWLKILDENSNVYQISRVLFFYRIQQNSMLRSMTNQYIEQTRWKLFCRNLDAYKKHFDSPQLLIARNSGLEDLNKNIINSYSYKLGNFILKPFSYIKSKFKTKKHIT